MAVRPIDGNELVDTLKQIVSDYTSHGMYPSAFPVEYAIEIVEKMPTLTPPNEWVSVEDAVPDPGERVLATDGIFVGEAYRTSADSWHRHTGFPWRDGVTGRTVKYWMLLPAPPAKEEQK